MDIDFSKFILKCNTDDCKKKRKDEYINSYEEYEKEKIGFIFRRIWFARRL